MSEKLYIDVYKKMAFFEEAADTIKTDAYNLPFVHLNHSEEKGYYFDVAVNKLFSLISFHVYNKVIFFYICCELLDRFWRIICRYRR